MAEVRMSLREAGALLGIAPNTLRSRWKAGKLRGEQDNLQKVWVWIDPEAANDQGSKGEASNLSNGDGSNPSKEAASKPSKRRTSNPSKTYEVSLLEDHLKTLRDQLATATAELAELRPRAAEADRLRAEDAGLHGQLAIRAEQLEELRRLLGEAKAHHAEELARLLAAQPAKGFFARLFGR